MSDFLSVSIEGLPQLLSELKQYPSDIANEADAELNDAAEEIREKAIEAAPVNLGRLRQGITVVKMKVNDYEVTSNALYSPYVEFGTGELVNVPAELTSYALQFKGRGVRKVNLPARPFLFPAFFEVRQKLLEKIKKVIGK